MPFANSGDPKLDPREGSFENLPAGTYTITGIADYFSKDDLGYPCFIPVGNELQARCHFSITENSSALPAWQGTKESFYNLAKALGANVEGLKVEPTTEYLGKIQARIDGANCSSRCATNDKGWVKKIDALQPPSGFYRITFKNAFSLDKTEPLTFQAMPNSKFEGNNEVVRLQFEVVSDIEGDTGYAGNNFLVNLYNPFNGVENGEPSFNKAKNMPMYKPERRLRSFLSIFWPDVEDYKWVSDPEDSIYGVDEAANPIVVIVDKARASGKQALCQLELTEQGYTKMDLLDLKPAKGAPLVGVTPKAAPAAEPTVKMHMNLIKVINDHAYPDINGNVFEATPENPYHLSEKGAGWCKENVAPVWDSLGYGMPRNFGVLSSTQASALIDAIQAKLGTSEF
jgi:hypothetical protein